MVKLADIEKRAVLSAIVEHDYDLEAAAETLGITKRTVYRMLVKWGLPTPVGGSPHTTKWSEHRRRCGKILSALQSIQKEEP
jgi:transposase